MHYLERNVNARFRCLLDNTCGFLRIDIRGKLMSLHGLPQSYVIGRSDTNSSGNTVLGLVAICSPFVPPNVIDQPSEDPILKTKHSLDFTLISMDNRVRSMLELDDKHLPMSFYSLVHVGDALCLAEAHKEVVKNSASGLLIYRLISVRSKRIYWIQSSCRMFYKNGKPESIGLTHRLLTEVEGTMLLEKRASLKAKLLSFDDSLLQSPRNLQSTAALPSSSSTVAVAALPVMPQPNTLTGLAMKLANSDTSSTVSSASSAIPAYIAQNPSSSDSAPPVLMRPSALPTARNTAVATRATTSSNRGRKKKQRHAAAVAADQHPSQHHQPSTPATVHRPTLPFSAQQLPFGILTHEQQAESILTDASHQPNLLDYYQQQQQHHHQQAQQQIISSDEHQQHLIAAAAAYVGANNMTSGSAPHSIDPQLTALTSHANPPTSTSAIHGLLHLPQDFTTNFPALSAYLSPDGMNAAAVPSDATNPSYWSPNKPPTYWPTPSDLYYQNYPGAAAAANSELIHSVRCD
ncbi:unnamed protein product [Anisakis simplex]|uniref:Aryl hydrocarbon receptor protein 1 (inferred by orthology to a C. elegans protein) n=1 Tax=Anisakis simplex TaxID=6269 RepID=A0A0M3KBT7_ANISI|nr:unnamed protein product [Anisakis simplex]